MVLIEAKQVSKCFRQGLQDEVWALHNQSLVVPRGSFCVLVGPSGCGKTTFLSLLGGLDRPTHGQVFRNSHDISKCSDVEMARIRRRSGFVFQNFGLIPDLPVWENITYPLVPIGIPRAERFYIAATLLKRFRLENKLQKTLRELSAGEQQRIAVARALAVNAEVILADEPTSNLDRTTKMVLLSCFEEFHSCGNTLVVSSHDPELIRFASSIHDLSFASKYSIDRR